MKQKLLYIGTALPLVILICIVGFIYGVYVHTFLLPRLHGEHPHLPIKQITLIELNDYVFEGKYALIAAILHYFLLVFFITLYRVVNTNPGHVPTQWLQKINSEIQQYIQTENNLIKKSQNSHTSTSFSSEIDEEQRQQLNLRAKIELIDKQGRRFCKNCSAFKPKRCHHCRQCKTCWLKMDHHCQWLNNCIGLMNYKFFINLLVYGCLTLGFIIVTYSRTYYETLYSHASDGKLFLVSFILLYVSFLGINNQFIRAILSNITTLEFCEAKETGPSKSAYENFTDVFGHSPLVWVLPIQPDIEIDLD
ncbi:hypothetical protein pb186bvf_019550 [Paramecium bursaria]